jgi:eukaryotic-like serine/threonine-protein kinase
VLHQIGSGVLGPVFRTYEPQRDRLVAVKAFKLDLVPEDVARLADALRRLVASPTTYPGIVRVLDAGLEGTSAFVAMEYASGESLDVALRDFPPGLARALPLLIDIGRAIDAAWAEGRGHGALHPRDVIVSTGVADTRITGFGITSALESIGVRAPVRRPYSAPERGAGEPWDIRADVYSLGAIAHELLTGRRPVGSGEQDGTLAPDLTPEQRVAIRRVIGKALAEKPDDRYPNAAAFLSELETIAGAEGGIAPVTVAAATPALDFFPSEKPVSKPAADAHSTTPRTWHPTPPDAPRPPRESAVPPGAKPASRSAAQKAPPARPGAASAAPAPSSAKSGGAAPASGAPAATTGRTTAAKPTRAAEAAPKPAAPAEAAPAAASIAAGAAAIAAGASAGAPPPSPSPEPAVLPSRDTRHLSITRVEPDVPMESATAASAPLRTPAPAPVASHTALGSSRISLGPGAYQPVFSTRDTTFDSPSYPWAGLAAAVIAALALGAVGGYLYGVRSAPPMISQASVERETPAGQTATDVPVTEPAQKPATESSPAPSRPASPTADAQKSGSRSTPAATRVADVRGRIVVRSEPSGAIVRVDGRLSGETPLTVRDLALGAHSVQIARPGYVPRTDRVTLTRGSPSQTVSVQLEAGVDTTKEAAAVGSVFVDSRPRGAKVTIDGRDAGVTPVQIPEVALGRRSVRLELAGFKTLTADVVVTAGPPAKLAVTLEQVR